MRKQQLTWHTLIRNLDQLFPTLRFLSGTKRSISGFSKPERFTCTCTRYSKILNIARIPTLPLGCSTRWAESWFSKFSFHYFSSFCSLKFSCTLYSLHTYCFIWCKPNIFLLLLQNKSFQVFCRREAFTVKNLVKTKQVISAKLCFFVLTLRRNYSETWNTQKR